MAERATPAARLRRRWAARASTAALAATAVLAGGTGGAAPARAATPAGMATSAVDVTLAYTCAIDKPIALTGLSVPVTLSTTFPTAVAAGTVVASGPVAETVTPFPAQQTLVVVQGETTMVQFDALQQGFTVSGGTPTTVDGTATGLPASVTVWDPTFTTEVPPLLVTAGPAGALTIGAGPLTFTGVLQNGTDAGTTVHYTCAPPASPTVATVPVVPAGAAPSVAALFPAAVPAGGYTVVWVEGSSFAGVTRVSLVSATDPAGTAVLFRVFSPTMLAVIVPPGPPGVQTVDVANASGDSGMTPAAQLTRT